MKKLICIGLVVLLQSCATKSRLPFYTTVDKVCKLQLGSSISDVNTLLGVSPHNVLSGQVDGYTIFVYKYKISMRYVNPIKANLPGEEKTGVEVYDPGEYSAYLFFKENKLSSFLTTEGKEDGGLLVMLDNSLFTFSNERGKYVLTPTVEKEKKGLLGKAKPKKSRKNKE